MARSSKKRRAATAGAPDPVKIILRELGKGNARDALKQARVLVRESATPENRQLLERVYLARIEQLMDRKQLPEGRAVLRELIDLKPTSDLVLQKLPRLKVALGEQVDQTQLFESNPGMLVELADQAVLDWQLVAPRHADVQQQVELVRQALQAIEQGDDARSATLLQDLPRQSPLSDWRLFARGLSAFYARDDQRTRENWRRLDPARPAYRIAQTLLAAAGESHDETCDVSRGLERIDRVATHRETAIELQQLATAWREPDWPRFLHLLRTFTLRAGKRQPELVEKVLDMTWKRACLDRNSALLRRLSDLPGPRLDPNWHRARALLESRDGHDPRPHWQRYLAELQKLAGITDDERRIARALIGRWIGRALAQQAQQAARSFFRISREEQSEESQQLRREALDWYKQAQASWPGVMALYGEMVQLYEDLEEPEQAVAVLEQWAERDPDNFDVHVKLVNYCLGLEQPGRAESHLAVVERLKPRDPEVPKLRWNRGSAMVCELARKRKFDQARAELEQVAATCGFVNPVTFEVMRAGIEFKARKNDAAQQFVDAALAKATEPAVVWLLLSSVAARYRTPKEVKKRYEELLKQSLAQKGQGHVVGPLAQILAEYKVRKLQYTGRTTHERMVLKYLDKIRISGFAEEDLYNVCQFLREVPRRGDLLERFARYGIKQFPQNAFFHFTAAKLEMDNGHYGCNIQFATEHMERAYELIQNSSSPADRAMRGAIEQSLSALRDMRSFSPYAFDEYDDDEWDDDDDEWDGDESDDDNFDFPIPDTASQQEIIAGLEKAMPPEIRALAKQAAKERGMSIPELMQRTLFGGMADDDDD